ncbi:phosphohistidine phosphatase [Mariprofundus micogutta]|uniref:Phosphohistidine phosphatase n=1 Tax=Mariprofundus micogutta TaxID=1921010 RepID=A0A1L8CMB3_9PROT|nr:histidine phosphatase family protein [Mariprofundus micogutta]GAV20046.1 phosphohistidine phosphatase [Mariprofundus micogutta]
MKKLMLMRHAKSSWSDFGTSDFDRELNARGMQDAPEMGRRLVAKAMVPDAFLVSTARRARATANLMVPELGFSVENIQFKDELYLASPAEMLKLIRQTSDHVQTLALLAHNPGITELTNRLAKTWINNIPTCGVAVLQFQIEQWQNIDNHAELLDFDYPKRVS